MNYKDAFKASFLLGKTFIKMKNYLKKINNYLEKNFLNYIEKVSGTLYPKPHLKEDDDDDDEPILFI